MFFTLGVPCIHPVYFGLRPFAPFQYIFTYQKKKTCLDVHLQTVRTRTFMHANAQTTTFIKQQLQLN
jgi:hypothetical protein